MALFVITQIQICSTTQFFLCISQLRIYESWGQLLYKVPEADRVKSHAQGPKRSRIAELNKLPAGNPKLCPDQLFKPMLNESQSGNLV